MITPDTKDWTWVLGQPCPECGFDASTCAATEVPRLVRENAADWQALLESGAIHPGRPDEATWSSLEYACHVRDVFRRYEQRIVLMLTQDGPTFPNWDQDASAETERYDEQDPTAAVEDLREAAEQLARRLGSVSGDEWGRTGHRSDGASFTVDTISRYMVHDVIHHVWDLREPTA